MFGAAEGAEKCCASPILAPSRIGCACTNCDFPLYTSITTTPVSFGRWDIRTFTWDSAWWTFNAVANLANLRYRHMLKAVIEARPAQFKLPEDRILRPDSYLGLVHR